MSSPFVKVVGTSVVTLDETATEEFRNGVWLKAASTNAGTVYVSTLETVTTPATAVGSAGYGLAANQEIFLAKAEAPSLAGVYAIASASSQHLHVWPS
jgi:hypothetical protein